MDRLPDHTAHLLQGAVDRANQCRHRDIPLAGLPAAAGVLALDAATRDVLAAILLDLSHQATRAADASWRTHKAPVAWYGHETAVHAARCARLMRPHPNTRRTPQVPQSAAPRQGAGNAASRSALPETRNPVLKLASMARIAELSYEQRTRAHRALHALRAQAAQIAQLLWTAPATSAHASTHRRRRRRDPMAVHWKAAAVYSRHLAVVFKPPRRPRQARVQVAAS